MIGRVDLRAKCRQTEKRFLLISGQPNMLRQTEHLKELNCLIVKIGKDDASAVFFRDVDDAQEDRDPDAVDKFSIDEIDHQRAATRIKLSFTLTFDS